MNTEMRSHDRPQNGRYNHIRMTMTHRENLISVLQVLYRWRKTIRNICLAVLVGAVLFSLTLKNFYQATTVFYPASPELANPELIFGYTGQVTNYFGSDRDLDRLSEIANSNELVDHMIHTFGLYQHYGIDSTSKQGPFKVREIFRGLYKAEKNKHDAIELSIEDTDPKLAAAMANGARDKINKLTERLTKNSQARLLATFDENIRQKTKDLERLSDSLRRIQSEYHVYNATTQGERLALQLSWAEADIIRLSTVLEVLEKNPRIRRDTIDFIRANLRAAQRSKEQLMAVNSNADAPLGLPRFTQVSDRIAILTDLHGQARKQLSFDLERYHQIRSAYNTDIPAVHIIELAEVPLVKSRPKRSILVLTAVIAALVLSILGVLLLEAYRDVEWREIVREEERDPVRTN